MIDKLKEAFEQVWSIEDSALIFAQNSDAMKYLDLICMLRLTKDRRKKRNIKRKLLKLKIDARKRP